MKISCLSLANTCFLPMLVVHCESANMFSPGTGLGGTPLVEISKANGQPHDVSCPHPKSQKNDSTYW